MTQGVKNMEDHIITSSLIDNLFQYSNYYYICDGITRYHLCCMKRDVCPDIRAGYFVDDIIVYDDGQMDIYAYGRKYRTPIYLCTGIPTVTSDE